MPDTPKFGLFDKYAETKIESRHLPHWFQPGTAVFITLRTADCLPRPVVIQWMTEVQDWLRQSGISIAAGEPLPDADKLPGPLQAAYKKQRDRLWHWHLDSCHGECVLRGREQAEFVMNSLLHFNGSRYDISSAIIMPNHAHLIAQFYPPTDCRQQCTSWMHYSAHKINRSLNRSGEFWQSEPFDHLIRSEAQFHYLQDYIRTNGTDANLPDSDWLFWSCES